MRRQRRAAPAGVPGVAAGLAVQRAKGDESFFFGVFLRVVAREECAPVAGVMPTGLDSIFLCIVGGFRVS